MASINSELAVKRRRIPLRNNSSGAGSLRNDRPGWIDTKHIVAFLRETTSYPEQPETVEVIETHKSWVFLTQSHAYKLKKPIRYDSIDFHPLQTRCANCEAEVTLNRRLAGDVYLGVDRITVNSRGDLQLGGDGPLVDCLVKMKRLPEDRMLSHLIDKQRVSEQEAHAIATKLARFYRDSLSVIQSPEAYRTHLLDEMRTNLAGLSEPGRGLDSKRIERLHDCQMTFIREQVSLLDERVLAGMIVDGHGDLRTEHICVLPNPVIFDCLEFDDRLRLVDPVDELAFLSMECERLGNQSIGAILFSVYTDVTGDQPPAHLIAFYTVYRACMWARLAIWRTRELEREKWAKWTDRAKTYLRIAEVHAGDLESR
jgi:uncharacterized protein